MLSDEEKIEFVKEQIKKYIDDFVDLLSKCDKDLCTQLSYSAAKEGNIEVVKLMIEYGPHHFGFYNRILAYAAENGHIDIVKFMIEYCECDYSPAIYFANKNKHLEIVELLEQAKKERKKRKQK